MLFNDIAPFNIQVDLSDLASYLNLKKSKILASKLKVWIILDKDTKTSSFHRSQDDYFIS
jgi:hypothetical protein